MYASEDSVSFLERRLAVRTDFFDDAGVVGSYTGVMTLVPRRLQEVLPYLAEDQALQ